MLAPPSPRGLAPPPRGNPVSATGMATSPGQGARDTSVHNFFYIFTSFSGKIGPPMGNPGFATDFSSEFRIHQREEQ